MRSESLAINGGEPAVRTPTVDGEPGLGTALYGELELAAMRSVVESRTLWRYRGWRVAAFEEAVAGRLRIQHAAALSSGTAALFLMFAALRERTDRRIVAMPTVGFVSAVTSALAAGFSVEFLPVDTSLGLDVDALRERLARDATIAAVLAVHPYGEPCAIESLRAETAAHGVVLLEDAAQCFAGEVGGRAVGTFGWAAALSFQAFKLLSTGEGGMVVSDDESLIRQVRLMHDASAPWTLAESFHVASQLAFPPLNMRMSEIEGAIGLVQLQRVDDMVAVLHERSEEICQNIARHEGYRLRKRNSGHGVHSSVIFFAASRPAASWTVAALRAEGVPTTLFLPESSGNRHWAGSWSALLAKCGADGPPIQLLERERLHLDRAIHLPLDVIRPERAAEVLLAVDKVMRASCNHVPALGSGP